MIFNSRERIEALTAAWTGARLDDGRPKVSDDILQRLKAVTNEEAWGVIEKTHGYFYNFAGDWKETSPDTVITGRAVTCQMVPIRPDLNAVVQSIGDAEGRRGSQNNWVIDSLQPGDVLVVDLFGKVRDGTFVGDNLSTAARRKTGTGMVIEGGIRDTVRIRELSDYNIFCRGFDPSAINDVTLIGVNIPVRIGPATVMPGDVVLGTSTGVSFIPPHLAAEVADVGENVAQRDVWGKAALDEGKYLAGEIDVPRWAAHIEAAYEAWCKAQGLKYTPWK